MRKKHLKTSSKIISTSFKNLISLLSLIIILTEPTKSGRVLPGLTHPITVSFQNAKIYADYTISFLLDNDLPADGYIIIKFPSQYPEYLGTKDFLQTGKSITQI
jgi:hypothetical protein